MSWLDWDSLKRTCENCTLCDLHKGRNKVVFGEGRQDADVMFIGEGPGADEDKTGRPFVGRAGKLLTLALEALGINREDIYIANIVKCRPPGNRAPNRQEANKCINYLRNQVALIKPSIIVCLGSTAMKYIIDNNTRITEIRGKITKRKDYYLIATFHPAALLRDESKKVPFWYDMKKVFSKLKEIKGG